MIALGGIPAIRQVLRNPSFAVFSAGNAISLIGTWMQRVAAGWLAWELTGSTTWLGVIAFADLFPTVVVAVVAGAAADRWDRLRVTKVTQAWALAQSLLLFVLTASGTITIWLLLILTFFLGVVSAFNQPARLAMMPSLLPRSELAAAAAVNSLVFNLARFIGPSIAGALIAVAGLAPTFLANSATFVVFLIALGRIHPTASPQTIDGVRPGLSRESWQGIRYALAHEGIAAVLVLLFAAAVGGRAVIEMLPGFAAEVFRAGPTGLAALTSAIGAGAVIGGLSIGGSATPRHLLGSLLFSTPVAALGVMLLTATDILWLSLLPLTLLGFGIARVGISAQTLIQVSVEPTMLGRVLGIYGLIYRGGPALGALIMGVVAEHTGLRLPVLVGAVFLAVAALWTWLRREFILRTF